jgi:hypothetical protein
MSCFGVCCAPEQSSCEFTQCAHYDTWNYRFLRQILQAVGTAVEDSQSRRGVFHQMDRIKQPKPGFDYLDGGRAKLCGSQACHTLKVLRR